MASLQSKRNLQLRGDEETITGGGFPNSTAEGCPYCAGPLPARVMVCRVCRHSLPEFILLKTKLVLSAAGLVFYSVLTAEKFLYIHDVLWLKFQPTFSGYVEWFLVQPAPFGVGAFISGWLLVRYFKRFGR